MKSILIAMLLISSTVHAENERYYQDKFCAGIGVTEKVLDDRTRVDCLTIGTAIEVEWAMNFYAGVGQSLFYSIKTKRNPGIALILRSKIDCKYLNRLKLIISGTKPRILLWEIGDYAYQCG